MDYRPISSLLDRVKNIISASDIQQDLIQSIIKDSIKKEIPREQILFKRGVLSFNNLSPVYKNEIFINKKKIIENAKIVNIKIIDIK